MTRGAREADEAPSPGSEPASTNVAEVALRACQAAVAAGAIDWLQAEALMLALEPAADPGLAGALGSTLAGALSRETHQLGLAVGTVVARFQDEESEQDLEEMAVALAELESRARRLVAGTYDAARPSAGGAAFASSRWLSYLDVACRHVKEAGDLVDDGMPVDDVCFELAAAAAALSAAINNPDPPSA